MSGRDQRSGLSRAAACCGLTSWCSESARALARSERGGNVPPCSGDSLPWGPQPNASELEPAGCSAKGLPYLDMFFLEQDTWRMRKRRDAWVFFPCCCCSATLLHLLSPHSWCHQDLALSALQHPTCPPCLFHPSHLNLFQADSRLLQ